jgi:hypothetical protein
LQKPIAKMGYSTRWPAGQSKTATAIRRSQGAGRSPVTVGLVFGRAHAPWPRFLSRSARLSAPRAQADHLGDLSPGVIATGDESATGRTAKGYQRADKYAVIGFGEVLPR